MFNYGGGKTGLMGEAGTEAILPLSRGSGGDLGVKASVTPTIVNIYNNSGQEVQTKEGSGPNGERTLDVIIQSKVKEGFATGAFDKTMRQAYGITRKGS
jgi:phage-related minor tail protein